MSSVFYRHESNLTMVKKGIKTVVKESVLDGTKGVSFVFLEKNGEKFYRISGKQLESGEYEIKEKKDNDETTSEMKEGDVMKLIAKNKKLAFIENYMKKERSVLLKEQKEGGAKKGSKKVRKTSKSGGSKKTSKKTSKKVKKTSKIGGSKKTSKKTSKKVKKTSKIGGAKKTTKKTSKKVKKTSKKA